MSEPLEPNRPDLPEVTAGEMIDGEYIVSPPTEDEQSDWDDAVQKRLDRELEQGSKFQPVEIAEDPIRFSVRDFLIVTTLAAGLLAIVRFIPSPGALALGLGVTAFIGLVVLSIAKPDKGIFHVGWWVLLVLYAVASMAAMFGSDSLPDGESIEPTHYPPASDDKIKTD